MREWCGGGNVCVVFESDGGVNARARARVCVCVCVCVNVGKGCNYALPQFYAMMDSRFGASAYARVLSL